MPDESDPPRKFYGLKPREFERANPAPPAASESTPPAAFTPDPGPNAGSDSPIDTRELARLGAANVPTLTGNQTPNRPSEIHAMLRENVARETAAGLNRLTPKKRRRSKRKSDYLLILISGNIALGWVFGIHTLDVVALSYGIGLMAMFSAGFTWIMFAVMDDY